MLTDVRTCAAECATAISRCPAAGLGVEFDREAAQKHPFEMPEPPHLRREDGSFPTGNA